MQTKEKEFYTFFTTLQFYTFYTTSKKNLILFCYTWYFILLKFLSKYLTGPLSERFWKAPLEVTVDKRPQVATKIEDIPGYTEARCVPQK